MANPDDPLEDIFGGNPTLNPYDSIDDTYSPFGGGGGNPLPVIPIETNLPVAPTPLPITGYTPPVPPNPTYTPQGPTLAITHTNIKINLISESGVVQFLENGNTIGYSKNTVINFSPSTKFVGPKKYEVKRLGGVASQYYEISIVKKYNTNTAILSTQPLSGTDLNINNTKTKSLYSQNLLFNFKPGLTAIDYRYTESINVSEYTLQSDGSYKLSDNRKADSASGVITLNFGITDRINKDISDNTKFTNSSDVSIQSVEYEVVFSSNFKNELGNNVILDYTIFSKDGYVWDAGSIKLVDGNSIKKLPLASLDGRVDFKIRYDKLPANFYLTNIYQTTNRNAASGLITPDYSKWNTRNSAFSLPADVLKTGVSIVALFEKEIQVERPSIAVDVPYKSISKQIKDSDIDSDISIPFTSTAADSISVYIEGKGVYRVIPLNRNQKDSILSLSFKNDFDGVYGTKKIILLAESNEYGAGDGTTILITYLAVNDFPSIIEIVYPQNIDIPAFSDYNIDYKISYTSFSASSIDIQLVLRDNNKVVLFKNQSPTGELSINVKKLRERFLNWNGKSITLIFTPFNRSGQSELIGNEYEITTILDIPPIEIDEDIFSTSIFDSFIDKLSIIDEQDSKYLSHLINFGNDEQTLISSWETDDWTLSEKESDDIGNIRIKNKVDSIILKLYTPLTSNITQNSTLWVTQLMANPLIETVILTEQDDLKCPPIKGPNFNINTDFVSGQSTMFESLDTIILSGSTSSYELVSAYLTSSEVGTSDLNIEYTDDTNYLWNNFVHFSSAKERLDNFVYKVKLIESYDNLIVSASTNYTNGASPQYTGSVSSIQEINSQSNKKQALIGGFDGFEKFLYTSSSLSWPHLNETTKELSTSYNVETWYSVISELSNNYDTENPNYVLNNIPEFIINNEDNDQFLLFFTMIGQHFDNIYYYTKSIERSRGLGYKAKGGISDKLLFDVLKSFNWDAKNLAVDSKLWEYTFGLNSEGDVKNTTPAKQRTYDVWRRIVNNLPYLLKHKGTRRGIYALLSCYGIPSSNLSILEFGGPEVSEIGKSKLVFDNITYGLNINNNAYLNIDWNNTVENRKPDTIEFFIKPSEANNYNIISGSGWGLNISGSAGQPYGKIIFKYAGNNQITSSLLPIFNDKFLGIQIRREVSGSYYNLQLDTRQADKERTIFSQSVAANITASNVNWDTGNYIRFGNNFVGTLDEFRMWSTPLDTNRFYEHVSFPEMINGNHISASTDDLHFRLDFEYPKNLAQNPSLINVDTNIYFSSSLNRNDYEDGIAAPLYSINPSASYTASANNFTNITEHPYQYKLIDRTVVLEIPDVGSTRYSTNKIRFEEQTLLSDLSPKHRSTVKSLDQTPTDSNRVGLLFSPTKELNLDIAKSFGGIHLDNYIGDPSDRYNNSYRRLDELRNYYFKRFNDRDIYAYINLIKLYEKSMFEDIKKMLPARVKATTGLLIEPHILERSKHAQKKPSANYNKYESVIDYGSEIVSGEYNGYEVSIDTVEAYPITGENNQYNTTIDTINDVDIVSDAYQLNSIITPIDDTKIETEPYYYECNVDAGLGGATIMSEIELDSSNIIVGQTDYESIGFGIFAQNGSAIRTYYDKGGNLKKERVRIQLIREIKTRNYEYLTSSAGVSGLYTTIGVETYIDTRINLQPFSGSTAPISTNPNIEITPVSGYLKTHYRNTSDLTRGLENSFYRGSKNTASTTLDGSPPIEIFITNPNTLRVNKAGRDTSEPILEVE